MSYKIVPNANQLQKKGIVFMCLLFCQLILASFLLKKKRQKINKN